MGSVDREKRIEDLVCTYPALFDLKSGFELLRQYRYQKAGRPDVLFRWPESSLVVEIKKVPLLVNHLDQLRGYLEAEAAERGLDDVKGLLLGEISARPHLLTETVRTWRFPVEILYLKADFMLEVRSCRSCLGVFWAKHDRCPHCRSTNHVLVEF